MFVYFSSLYISIRNNLSQLSQVSWSQYFSQTDSRTHKYQVEKMIDVNMGMFQEYIIKNILEVKKEGREGAEEILQQISSQNIAVMDNVGKFDYPQYIMDWRKQEEEKRKKEEEKRKEEETDRVEEE